MTEEDIRNAIDRHGAERVYNAASSSAEGLRDDMAAVGLAGGTVGDAWRVMRIAHASMDEYDPLLDG